MTTLPSLLPRRAPIIERMRVTPTQISAMSPATIHAQREARMDLRVFIVSASFVVAGVLVTMGDLIVRLVS